MSDIKLLPCPFCGGEAEMLNYSESEWLVNCPACGGMVEKWRKTEAEAIEQWNTRKPMERIVEQLEEAKDIAHDDSMAETVSTRIWNKAIQTAIGVVKGRW